MKLYRTAAALAAVLGCALPAHAGIADGDLFPPTLHGTDARKSPWLAGSVVATASQAFDFTTTFVDFSGPGFTYQTKGTVVSSVIKAVDGTFDFYWRVTNTTNGISHFNVDFNPVKGLVVTPNWRTDGPSGRAPQRADVSGGHVDYGFTDISIYGDVSGVMGSDAPGRSRSFFLDTNATSFNKLGHFSLSSTLDTQGAGAQILGNSPSFSTYAPSMAAGGGVGGMPPPVPEPETYALMLVGIAGLGWWHRRRRQS